MKIGVCGHYATGKQCLNGQTIRSTVLTEELERRYGKENVVRVDTYDIKKRLIPVFFGVLFMFLRCNCCIMFPAQNGIKIFGRMFVFLGKLFRRKIFHVVIGGWLPEYLDDKPKLAKKLRSFDRLFVQTEGIRRSLEERGFQNVTILPNCKKLDIVTPERLAHYTKPPYRLCTYSRVSESKGIGLAVQAVEEVNRRLECCAFTLDIYGQVEEAYRETFDRLMTDSSDAIRYGGAVSPENATEVLHGYFLLLFPTYYEGEGFAGTLLDAMAAGLPAAASDWRFNREVLDDSIGFLYEAKNADVIMDLLLRLYRDPEEAERKRPACAERATHFHVSHVAEIVVDAFGKTKNV